MNLKLMNTPHTEVDDRPIEQVTSNVDNLKYVHLLLTLDKALKRLTFSEAQNLVKALDLASIHWIDAVEYNSTNLTPIQALKKHLGIVSRRIQHVPHDTVKSCLSESQLTTRQDDNHHQVIRLNAKKKTSEKLLPAALRPLAKSTNLIASRLELASDTLESLVETQASSRLIDESLALWLARQLANRALEKIRVEADTFAGWMSRHGFSDADIAAVLDATSDGIERDPAAFEQSTPAHIAEWVIRMGESDEQLADEEKTAWEPVLTNAGFDAAEVWDVIDYNQKQSQKNNKA